LAVLTASKFIDYNRFAGWRGILLSPASFSFETLAPHQPAFFIYEFSVQGSVPGVLLSKTNQEGKGGPGGVIND